MINNKADYAILIPSKGLYLVAVVDPQKRRLVACVRAIRRASARKENAELSSRKHDTHLVLHMIYARYSDLNVTSRFCVERLPQARLRSAQLITDFLAFAFASRRRYG